MKRKSLYIISAVFICVYIFSLSLIFKTQYTYSYKMYYIDKKTAFYSDANGLEISFVSEENYKNINENGYQYLGKDFEIIKEEKQPIRYLMNENSTIYYQVKEKEVYGYKIVFKMDDIDINQLSFTLNGEMIKGNKNNEYIEIKITKVQEYNELNIKGADRTELYIADEAFYCGTGAQVMPVTKIDHRPVGTGATGKNTEKLQKLYFDLVRGELDIHREWLTEIY